MSIKPDTLLRAHASRVDGDPRCSASFSAQMTAAGGLAQQYSTENNRARFENPQEAQDLDRRQERAWCAHPQYIKIESTPEFSDKQIDAIVALTEVLEITSISRDDILSAMQAQNNASDVQNTDLESEFLEDAFDCRNMGSETHDLDAAFAAFTGPLVLPPGVSTQVSSSYAAICAPIACEKERRTKCFGI